MGERLGHRQAPSLIVAGIDGERARPVQCRQFAVGRIVNPYDMCLERRVALEARKYLIVAPAPSAGADQQRNRIGTMDADQLRRSEEHTSELQSLMRISYAVFCLKKKKNQLTI